MWGSVLDTALVVLKRHGGTLAGSVVGASASDDWVTVLLGIGISVANVVIQGRQAHKGRKSRKAKTPAR